MRIPIDDFPAHQSLHATYHKRCTACGRKFKTEHDLIAHVNPETIDKDPKTRLQEWLQGRKLALPSYEVVRTKGDAHKQTFWVACHVTNAEQQRLSTEAQSRSRQQGEKAAAEMMLTRLIEGH